MILVDTSVWVDHLRKNNRTLAEMLEGGRALTHPFIIGELALGMLRQRQTILASLQDLPRANTATDREVLFFIDRHRLAGRGIGYVDAHLLASAQLTVGATLWTHDKRLATIAAQLGLDNGDLRSARR